MTWQALLVTLILFATALSLEFRRLTIKPWPPRTFEQAAMHFKYGSIGAEVNGYPYLIWRELPSLFPDRIPRGYAEFGLLSEPGQDLPIGISVRRYGIDRVGFNCATCHTSTFSVADTTRLVLGAPAGQLDMQAYIGFLLESSLNNRLSANSVIESARKHGRPIGLSDRLILKHVVFPRLGNEIAHARASLAWMKERAPHGPGRTDAGNVWRARWGLSPERDSLVGTVDFPSVWNQRSRIHGAFHWDGNNSSLDERNISAALAGGTAEWLLDHNSIGRVSEWLLDLSPPPFPAALDFAQVARGRAIYRANGCAGCHDQKGNRVGETTPLEEVGTDPERANLFSEDMVKRFREVGAGYSWQFRHYRETRGYANLLLDGIWMRGPFLHNGSIPSLAALLSPVTERPTRFRYGCRTFDVVTVGFTCSSGSTFDTSLRGNSNRGHEYGTRLSDAEKLLLLEYLKSL